MAQYVAKNLTQNISLTALIRCLFPKKRMIAWLDTSKNGQIVLKKWSAKACGNLLMSSSVIVSRDTKASPAGIAVKPVELENNEVPKSVICSFFRCCPVCPVSIGMIEFCLCQIANRIVKWPIKAINMTEVAKGKFLKPSLCWIKRPIQTF